MGGIMSQLTEVNSFHSGCYILISCSQVKIFKVHSGLSVLDSKQHSLGLVHGVRELPCLQMTNMKQFIIPVLTGCCCELESWWVSFSFGASATSAATAHLLLQEQIVLMTSFITLPYLLVPGPHAVLKSFTLAH